MGPQEDQVEQSRGSLDPQGQEAQPARKQGQRVNGASLDSLDNREYSGEWVPQVQWATQAQLEHWESWGRWGFWGPLAQLAQLGLGGPRVLPEQQGSPVPLDYLGTKEPLAKLGRRGPWVPLASALAQQDPQGQQGVIFLGQLAQLVQGEWGD